MMCTLLLLLVVYDFILFMLAAWCRYCDHKGKRNPVSKRRKADCSRTITVEGKSAEEIAVLRRFLMWWCYRAKGLSRKEHQDLSRDCPPAEELLEADEWRELIMAEYESDRDDDDLIDIDDCA